MPKPDYGGAAGGATSGAMAGFQMGGPWGAAAGGVLGGVGGLFSGKKKAKKRSTMDKQQKALYADELAALRGDGPLADLYNYDPEGANAVFDQTVANPAYRKFEEDLVPKTTGAFRSQGLQNSSYVGDAVSKMARDIQEGLDAQRTKYLYGEQSDARNAKRNAVQNIQGRTTFDYDTSPQSGGFDINKILGNISPDQMSAVQNYFKTMPAAGVA